MKVEIGPYCESRVMRIKIHEYDCWNADHTLAMIIHPLLKRIKCSNAGIPGSLYSKNGWEVTSADHEEAHQKWAEILNKMIWTMEQLAGQEHDEPKLPESFDWKEWVDEEGRNRFEFVCQNKEDEIEYDKAYKEYHARIQEGCELFGKHFRHLWT